jgi:hypothetical protein
MLHYPFGVEVENGVTDLIQAVNNSTFLGMYPEMAFGCMPIGRVLECL